MKTLYLVRHAKSSWKENVEDHKRPLKKRGKHDAMRIAETVSQELQVPEKIISSDAQRAVATALFFKKAWNMDDSNFQTEPRLYDFQGGEVFQFIKELDDQFSKVMLVGHNYAFTAIANRLGNKPIEEIPTCGFVVLNFDVENWENVVKGTIEYKLFPRTIR